MSTSACQAVSATNGSDPASAMLIDAGFSLQRLLIAGLNIRGAADAQSDPARLYARIQAEVAAIRLAGMSV